MITKEKFLEKCIPLYPEYDFSNIEWVSYSTPIKVICKIHGEFEIYPYQLGEKRSRCKGCRHDALSAKNKANAKERLAKARKTNLERYGVENVFASKEIQEQIKQTAIERHGGIGMASKEIALKIAKTKEERYGDPTFTNREKCSQTIAELYNANNFGQTPNAIEKKQQTWLQTLGVDNPLKSSEVRAKGQQTMLSIYGYENYGESEESRNYLRSDEFKQKRRESLHKNSTYNKSQSEDRCYEYLKTIFPDVKRQYSSEVYPFACDLYVPSLDLYIELNFFWTHGSHFFDEQDENDLVKLEEMKSKHTQFYDNAVYVWTTSDKKKLETALKNNLNYLVCWSEEEFYQMFSV